MGDCSVGWSDISGLGRSQFLAHAAVAQEFSLKGLLTSGTHTSSVAANTPRGSTFLAPFSWGTQKREAAAPKAIGCFMGGTCAAGEEP